MVRSCICPGPLVIGLACAATGIGKASRSQDRLQMKMVFTGYVQLSTHNTPMIAQREMGDQYMGRCGCLSDWQEISKSFTI